MKRTDDSKEALNETPARHALLAQLVFPGFLLYLIWISSGFSLSATKLFRVFTIWAVLYVPIKTAKVLIQHKGLVQYRPLFELVSFGVLASLWLLGVLYSFLHLGLLHGLAAIPAFGYPLVLIWLDMCGHEGPF